MTTATIEPDAKLRQRLDALANANKIRMAGVAVRRDLGTRQITLEQALVDPRAQSMTLYALLHAQYRWGRTRTLKALTHHRISESRRVEALTDRQRGALVEWCGR